MSRVTDVGVKWSAVKQRASYVNLQVCGRLWNCPICAAKISENRRHELVALLAEHERRGGIALLVTRTFPHQAHHALADLKDRLSDAENRYKAGNPWRRLVARHRLIGSVRAVEVTCGQHGWHPHIHEIVLIEPGHEVDLARLKADLYARWRSACLRAGLDAPTEEHGLDVRDGSFAAKYAAKWGMEHELTKWHVKSARGGLSPWDLLRLVLHGKPAEVRAARGLFDEFASAMHGTRQLVWSPGLRDLYGLGEELSEKAAAEGHEPDAELLGSFTLEQWRAVVKANLRGELLEAINASGGDWSSIDVVLGEALARHPPPPTSVASAPSD